MKISIELDAADEGHKIDSCIRGHELKMILDGLVQEMQFFLKEGHPFLSADAAMLHLLDRIKKDSDYFKVPVYL